MRRKSKALILTLCVALLVAASVLGTLAYLTAQSAPVVNTFKGSNVQVDLAETTTDYKMIPGCKIAKDPKATVRAGSVECWLFVKLEESENFDDFMTYAVDTSEGEWTLLRTEERASIYYRKILKEDIGKDFPVLAGAGGGEVTVKETVTKEMMDELTEETYPTLTITAYASQLYKNNTDIFEPAEAWDIIVKDNIG